MQRSGRRVSAKESVACACAERDPSLLPLLALPVTAASGGLLIRVICLFLIL
uniref:Uncharacterized protein n=1 Tax=Arundo donax TaxID=35708 RepID=A0A0A9GFV6_ARUDO